MSNRIADLRTPIATLADCDQQFREYALLTKSLAVELGRTGITVNCVCPGVIDTAMVASVVANPQYRAAIEQMTPMGRMGTAEEVAHAVVWLCSPRASFVTGHAMVIDGGATAI